MEPALILPCETRVREFDAKLLLACHAAERGWRVVVGQKRSIDLEATRLPRGIYVGKSLTHRNFFLYRIMQRLGQRLVAWDEEGLVYANPELYRRSKIGSRTLNLPELLFAWGEENARAWREHPAFCQPDIAVSGNPRTDLLRPELRNFFDEQVRALRAEHGDFVLINTNFSRLNHYFEQQNRQQRLLRDGGDAIENDSDPRVGLARHKARLFEAFQALVPALAKRFPATPIVIRPHPSENDEIWQHLSRGHANVRVVHQGNGAAWLQAASVTIHNGCTTAVESFLLDRPALAWRPVTDAYYDLDLPNDLSLQAFTLAELFERVERVVSGDRSELDALLEARRDIACRHIASLDGAMACERILDRLGPLAELDPPAANRLPRLGARLQSSLRRGVRQALSRMPSSKQHPSYQQRLFPDLSLQDVEAGIASYGASLGRFQRLRVRPWGRNCFLVEA